MESLFLFFFSSCLRGDEEDRLAYYRLLDVDPSSSQEAIKKSFKKKSLSIHPDKLAQRGIEITTEYKLEFQRLKEAYEVLTDPKRKKLYDQVGETGLKLMENPNPVTLIKNFQKHRADQCSIVFLLAFLFGCLFILPILFVLKCDSTLGPSSPWVAIWTPMWVVDLILLIMAIFLFVQKDEESMEEDENGKPIPLDDENKIPLSTKILNFITIVLLVLIQLFVTIRLDGYTSWNWFGVFAPWFIFESIQIVMHGVTAFSTVPMPDYSSLKSVTVGVGPMGDDDDEDGNDAEEYKMKRAHLGAEYYGELYERTQARNGVMTHLLRVWLAVFLALQANRDVRWTWGLVLFPIWVHILKQYVFAMVLRSWGLHIVSTIGAGGVIGEVEDDAESDMKRTVGMSIANTYIGTIINTLPLTFMAILLVCRLEERVFTTFVIILPVFMFLSCGCCALFCGLFFIVNADTDEMSRRMDEQFGQQRRDDEKADVEGGGSSRAFYTPPGPIPTPMPDSSSPLTDALRGVEMGDISVTLAQADRNAHAALYGSTSTTTTNLPSPSSGMGSDVGPNGVSAGSKYQTTSAMGAGSSSSSSSSGNGYGNSVGVSGLGSTSSGVFTPQASATLYESSTSSSATPPTTSTPLLPATHIDTDID